MSKKKKELTQLEEVELFENYMVSIGEWTIIDGQVTPNNKPYVDPRNIKEGFTKWKQSATKRGL